MKMNNIFRLPLWIKDIQNYIDWIKTINKEKLDPNSKWYKFKMKHNYFYTIYFPISLPEEDRVLTDNIKRLRVVEILAPVHRYFDEELMFAEYIIPEFNQFFDDNNQPTLIYGIVYRFAFKKLSMRWLISRTIFTVALIWFIVEFPVFHWMSLLFKLF